MLCASVMVIFGLLALAKGEFKITAGRKVSGTIGRILGVLLLVGAGAGFFFGESGGLVQTISFIIVVVVGLISSEKIENSKTLSTSALPAKEVNKNKPGISIPNRVSTPNPAMTEVHRIAVKSLLETCPEVTRWMRDDPSPPMRRIREIGENLNTQGGKQLMQEVHAEFIRSGGAQWGRSIEMMWSGIGTWRG